MKLNKIEKLFESKAIIRHGVFLLKWSDAIEFVDECENRQIKILGVDAFFLDEKNIQPSLEHSVDFTSKSYIKKDVSNYDYARRLIEKKKDMYFEIVIDSPEIK
jgi:hypothetical protein